MAWGWRIPFIASIALIALSLYVQLRLEDTPAFRELQARRQAARVNSTDRGVERMVTDRSPVLEALTTYPKQIALAAGAFLGVQVTFYILITFVIAYASNPSGLGLPRTTLLTAVLISSVVQIPALFIASIYSDRHGRRGIYMLGAVLLGIWGFILFPLVDTGSFLLITLAVCVGQVIIGMMYGPQAAFLAEMFSTQVRYSGASLGYQLGAILGGGMAPIIATVILATYGSTIGISIYIAIACALTLLSVFLLDENHQRNLQDL